MTGYPIMITELIATFDPVICNRICSFCLAGIHSFTPLIQTPIYTFALVNSDTDITCSMKSHGIDQLGVFWYRAVGTMAEMEFIVFATVLDKHTYNAKFSKERYSVIRDQLQRTFILKIQNLRPTDTGIYYCMVQKGAQLAMGNGTIINVVNTLPTDAPTPKPTKKKPPCRCRGHSRGSKSSEIDIRCSPIIWGPLAGSAVLLLIFLGFLVSHTQRVYTRSRHFFRKQ
ncbi:T-cell surface glycoprotein CD8 beta chain [Pelodytes ibericus]